ncbi:MAG TPA: sigma-70 family RNA polymerase sigma factor [Bryobacteraceae bacterium]|jgi:RNA polymerase sigma factor (sigma-70 family)|nr:sigma-70 family RNA polymerase sigma factor [Bryobacteraceae bacterium]
MDADTQIGGHNARFPETRPSAISAAVSDDQARRGPGQEAMIAAYWKPVYRYIRIRWRCSNEDAKDLTQSFFTAAIEKSFFAGYDARKGTFRTFLRVCLDRFLSNGRKFASRQKRSSDFVVIDVAGAESPEDIFEREWTRSVFEDAVDELRANFQSRGRRVAFAVFERYDLAESPASYDELAREFGVTSTAVTNYLAAARRELRKLVLDRVRSVTSGDPEFRREARAILK